MIDQRGGRGAASCPRIQCLYAVSSVPSFRFNPIQVFTKLANRSSRLPIGNASGTRIGSGVIPASGGSHRSTPRRLPQGTHSLGVVVEGIGADAAKC